MGYYNVGVLTWESSTSLVLTFTKLYLLGEKHHHWKLYLPLVTLLGRLPQKHTKAPIFRGAE